jgi:hypothetical protein
MADCNAIRNKRSLVCTNNSQEASIVQYLGFATLTNPAMDRNGAHPPSTTISPLSHSTAKQEPRAATSHREP